REGAEQDQHHESEVEIEECRDQRGAVADAPEAALLLASLILPNHRCHDSPRSDLFETRKKAAFRPSSRWRMKTGQRLCCLWWTGPAFGTESSDRTSTCGGCNFTQIDSLRKCT